MRRLHEDPPIIEVISGSPMLQATDSLNSQYHGAPSRTQPQPRPRLAACLANRSHYFSAFPCEAILIFGKEHPDLFWEYLMAAFAIQDKWFNNQVKDKTPLDIQHAYVDVALDVLDKAGRLPAGPRSKAAGEMIDKLQVHDKANGGSTMFLDLKYLCESGRSAEGARREARSRVRREAGRTKKDGVALRCHAPWGLGSVVI